MSTPADDISTLIDTAHTPLDDLHHTQITRDQVDTTLPVIVENRTDGYLEPWVRQSYETDHTWEQFVHYRDQGIGRSQRKTADYFGVSPVTISTLASRHDWHDRVTAYDIWQERVYQAHLLKSIRDMAERHATIAAENLDALLLPTQAVMKKLEDNPNLIDELSETSAKQLIRLAVESAKVIPRMMNAERLSRGLPTEITHNREEVEHHVRTPDAGHLAAVVIGLVGTGALEGISNVSDGTIDTVEIVDTTNEPVHPDHTDT